MSQKQIDILERALAREKAARKQAEKILEDKSADLYHLTEELSKANSQLEISIQEQKSQLKGVFENIVDAYVVMDLQGNVLKMNQPAIDMIGYDSSIEKISLFHLVHRAERNKTTIGFRRLFENGVLTNFTLRIVTKNLEHKIVQINSSVIYDSMNNAIAAQGIVRDITKDKESQERLIASENRLAALILNLDRGVLLEDENDNIIITNKRLCEYFSVTEEPSKMVGKNYLLFAESTKLLFENPNQFVERIKELVASKEIAMGDELHMKSGRVLKRDFIPIYENNVYKGHLWSYKDVTLENRYKDSIEAERQKYSSIIANMNLGLLEVDVNDQILFANHSFLDMSGYQENELIGKVARNIFTSEDAERVIVKENLARLGGNSNSYELLIHKKNKEKRNWLISGAPQYNINGEVTGSIGIHLDVTELRNLQRQMQDLLDKLEKSNTELEEYAHIVSHDLKSPLRSLNALFNWLKEDNKGKFDENSLNNFDLVEKNLEKMERLISDILEYSSVSFDYNKIEKVDLNKVVFGLHDTLLIPNHIEFTIKNNLPILYGDEIKFQQLFLNLISNSVRYIDKEKGIIELDVLEFSSYYQFSIRDNGIGIEKKDFTKIFKIFQSLIYTKESTGIGLSIVKKIIDLYKGEIWLESDVGIGTTFYFTILKQKYRNK